MQTAATFSPGARVYTRYAPGGFGEGISYAEFEQATASGAAQPYCNLSLPLLQYGTQWQSAHFNKRNP